MEKTAAIRIALTQFAQQSGESLYQAWERDKEMLKKCPHHGMPDWMVINCFYNGLGAQSRPMLDAASGRALWAKSYEEVYELIEMMAGNEYKNPTQRLPQGNVAGILEVDTATAINAHLKAMTKKVDSLANYGVHQMASVCELCAGMHVMDQCAISSESSQFVSNFQRPQQPVPATYHPNNRNHSNFSWSNNQKADQKDGEAETKKNSAKHEQNIGDKQVYPPPPYPKRLQKQKFDKQFAKFLEVFKKFQINILFAEVLEQMPSYAKFMKDPGSFTIPCTIGELSLENCLCDLGASINPMPLSVFRKLGLPDPKPTNISLQLPDCSITYPRGIVEDVLVTVGELTMKVQDHDVTFNIFNAMKFSKDEEECYKVELVDSLVNSELDQLLRSDTLERALIEEYDSEDEEGAEQLQFLNASPWKRKLDLSFESL
ncbi:uncharacterized protein LOC141714358 [Apium graveolens]|uniref:uncharacterized protein LOC141714358 n=1 Tax=Apium graveolens TaxID=4045 RepID=UPI003D7AD270